MNDLRYAVRALSKTPSFVVVAILIVAVGIGAATSMFSAINALVLRPVSLPEPERLAVVYETNLSRNVPFFSCSYPNYIDWRDRNRSWQSLAAIGGRAMNLTGGSEPEFINVRSLTANFLPTLGIAPKLGRGFMVEEDRPGHNQVAIISHAFWQRRFAGRVGALGQSLLLDGTGYTVIGVLPAETFFPGEMDIAIPMGADLSRERRTNHEIEVYGRLRSGVSLAQADAELKSIAAQIWTEHAEMDPGWSTELMSLSREVVGPEVRTALFVLLGAVGLLLVISSANLSNLLLVRASARTHELAIRTALGAGRWRIIRQLVTESLIVTTFGGLLGVLLSLWVVAVLRSANLPRADEINIDVRVLAAACGMTLLVGCFTGVGPAWRASQILPQEALKGRSPRSGQRSRLRDTLVVAQLALSLALLIGATMLVRSFWNLLKVNPGFTTERVLTVSLRPADDKNAVSFYEQVTARVAALPEVAGVGLVSNLPLAHGNTSNNVFPVGVTVLPPGESIQSNWRLVDGGYFDALQIPLLRGRTFANLSPQEARSSVVLSASLARMLFGDDDPIGRQIEQNQVGGNRLTVVGVVGDVRSARLGTVPAPAFYWSMHRFLYGPMGMVIRTTGATEPLTADIRRVVKEVDPTVPVFQVRTMDEIRADSVSRERLTSGLLTAFAVVALVLATVGTYGVVAFTVQQRTQEIGIRMAVGAQTRDVLRLIFGYGVRLAVVGIPLGAALALAGTRLLSALLYNISAMDTLSYALAALALFGGSFFACWIPARRAAKVDPLVALRSE